jgi:hypothetical protein
MVAIALDDWRTQLMNKSLGIHGCDLHALKQHTERLPRIASVHEGDSTGIRDRKTTSFREQGIGG